jgi:hypothetical protein
VGTFPECGASNNLTKKGDVTIRKSFMTSFPGKGPHVKTPVDILFTKPSHYSPDLNYCNNAGVAHLFCRGGLESAKEHVMAQSDFLSNDIFHLSAIL